MFHEHDHSLDHPIPYHLLSNFLSGASAGLALELSLHGLSSINKKVTNNTSQYQMQTRLRMTKEWTYALYIYGGRSREVYRGASASLAAGGIWSGLFGFTYVPVKQIADDLCGSNPIIGPLAAASAASLTSSSVRVPLEYVRTLMDEKGWSSTRAFRALFLYPESKISANYRTLHRSAVLKSLPVDASLFVLYENLKIMAEARWKRDLTSIDYASIGLLSGIGAGCLTSPLEVMGFVVRAHKGGIPIGAREKLRTVLAKSLWSGFGAMVFFPSLEASITFFDLSHLEKETQF